MDIKGWKRHKSDRPGVAGVLAAVILFAAIFTTGVTFFLYVNNQVQSANQANVSRANNELQIGQEKLAVSTGLTSASNANCPSCLWVRANNTGGVSSTIIDIYVTCVSNCGTNPVTLQAYQSGQLLSCQDNNNCLTSSNSHFLSSQLPANGKPDLLPTSGSSPIALPLTLGVGASTEYLACGSSCDIAISQKALGSAYSSGEYVVIDVLTAKGNVFSAQYPRPPVSQVTDISVQTQSTNEVVTLIGGGPQLSVLLAATALCPNGMNTCTQTFSCSNGCVTVTATVYNLASSPATGVSLTLHTPYSDFVSGTASVSLYSACTPPSQTIPAGSNEQFTCQFNAYTGHTGGLASFSGYVTGTLNSVSVTSAEALSNSIEIGGLPSVTTQGAFAANFFYLQYSSCAQDTPSGGNFAGPCTTNVSPVNVNNMPSGSFIAAGSNFYVAYYVQITNVFNTSLPILQYSYTFGDPDISGEVYYFLAGTNSSSTGNVYYPNYSSNPPTLTPYPTDCNSVYATASPGHPANSPTDSNCIYVDPGQTVTLTFAACGYSATNWAWGSHQDAQGFDSSSGCTGNPPDLTVPEGMSMGITVTYLYKGQMLSQNMPFRGQAFLRSTATTVSCVPSALASGSTTCTATVTDNDGGNAITPTGTVAFSGQAVTMGSFSSTTCTLSGSGSTASCSVTYTPNAGVLGVIGMTATYGGDIYHASSSGSTNVDVGVALPITCTMANSAPSVTLALSSTGAFSPLPTTITCNGSQQSVVVPASSTVTVTEPTDGANARYRFTGGVTTLTTTACSSGTCSAWSFTNTLQLMIIVAASPSSGGTTTPAVGTYWENYGTLSITGTPGSGYHFSKWTSTNSSITFASSTSATTTATINGYGTITANFKGTLAIVNYKQASCVGSCSITISVSGFSTNAGDTLVVAVSNLRESTHCKTVSGIADSLGDSFSQGGGVTGLSSSECADSEVWYATASGGTTTITVTFTGTSSPDSAVLEVYDVSSALTPPTVATGMCAGGCTSSLSVSPSLSVVAGSFVVATGSVCQTSGGSNLQISSVSFTFTNRYGPGGGLAQYLGDTVASSSSSMSFGMTASGTPQCWSAIGATFVDPPKNSTEGSAAEATPQLSAFLGRAGVSLPASPYWVGTPLSAMALAVFATSRSSGREFETSEESKTTSRSSRNIGQIRQTNSSKYLDKIHNEYKRNRAFEFSLYRGATDGEAKPVV